MKPSFLTRARRVERDIRELEQGTLALAGLGSVRSADQTRLRRLRKIRLAFLRKALA